MKNHSILGLLVLSLLIVSGHSSAFALIDLNVGGGYNSNTASSSGRAEVDVDVEGGASLDTSATIETGQRLNINRAMLESDQSGSVETSSRAVLTNGDLRAYAQTALRSDDRLEELNFTGDRVEVSYKQQGRFLALVPITFKAKAVASADGEVELDYPWYAFLTLDDEEKVKTELKIAVDNALRARAVGSVRGEGEAENPFFTASESAEVATQMHAILKGGLEASESVD